MSNKIQSNQVDSDLVADLTVAAAAKTTPVDADSMSLVDSENSNVLKEITWANIKAALLTYFNAAYQPLAAVLTATTASFTSALETKLSGIEALADVTDAGNVGSSINGATAKATPVDADTVALIDSAASNVLKKVTWANIKAVLYAMADSVLSRPEIKDYAETVMAHSTMGATETFNFEDGNVHTGTLDANCTFSFSNPPATGKAGSITLILTQNGTGGWTYTWPAAVKWALGVAPTLSTGANDVNIVSFITINAGTTYYGFVGGIDFA